MPADLPPLVAWLAWCGLALMAVWLAADDDATEDTDDDRD
jgi:hypothetical protein